MNRRPHSRPAFTEALEPRAYLTGITFMPVVHYQTGANPAAIAAADLSGNGFQDAITANYGAGTISVLRGNGDGTFQPATDYPVGNSPDGLAVADVNGDGKPDILVANSGNNPADAANTDSNTISVLLNNGDGTFAPKQDYATGPNPTAVVVADVNGDGKPDLIATSSNGNNFRALLGNGDGTFTAGGDFATGLHPLALAAADLNGDGKIDIVTANSGSDSVSVLLGNGDGTFQNRIGYLTGLFPRSVTIADINQDGKPDIILACRGDHTADILRGRGNGKFLDNVALPSGGGTFAVAVADLNGDGLNDIITADQAAKSISILQRARPHQFLSNIDFRSGQGNEGVAVADLNGDGQPDLLVANFNDSTIGVLLNNSRSLALKKSAVKLRRSANPVRVGDTVTFTATVTGPKGIPTGDVTFFDGTTSLGIVPLVNGTATLAATLPVGVHAISSVYSGDATFAAKSSAAVSQLVTPSASRADLVGSFVSTTLPASFIAGQTATVKFRVTNQGDTTARGLLVNQLFLSTDGISDTVAVSIHGSLAKAAVKLLPGQSIVLRARFTIPTGITPGNYALLAQFNTGNTLAESDLTNNTAASAIIYSAVNASQNSEIGKPI